MLSPVHRLCAEARSLTVHQPGEIPPLGDALAVLAVPALCASDVVQAAIRSAPWCAIVVLVEPPLSVTEAGARLACVPRSAPMLAGGLTLPPARILAAIHHRPAPTAIDLIAYLRLRGLDAGLIAAVHEALAPATDTAPGGSLNRRLGAYGPLRTRSWRALLRILRFTSQPAGESGTDSRTFRARSQDLVGLAPRRVFDTPGWEWKLEATLRRHDYLPWPDSSRPAAAPLTTPALHEMIRPA